MLDNTYDGDYRLRHFCELKEKYKLGDYSEDVHAFDYINRMRQDLMVDNKILDNLILFGDVDIYCLLPWTRNSVFVEKKSRYVFKYPCVEGRDIPDTKHFEISLSDMYNFWIHKMYTLEANILRYRSFRDYGGGVGFCELPFNFASEDDGQLKITVDAVLAAGAMTSREKKKILVIGSSSKGVVSGLAYDVISSMFTNSEFHLYDSHSINASYEMDTNKFFHNRGYFVAFHTIKNYDLVLDDSWTEEYRISNHPEHNHVYDAKNYSIKKFPDERKISNNIYNQVFITKKHEQRAVSRDVKNYDYKYYPIGKCAACIELKYLLAKGVSLDYSRFMRAHKIDCLTKQKRSYETVGDMSYDYIEVEPISKTILNQCFKLSWDDEMVGNSLPMNPKLVENSMVKISDDRYLTGYVLSYAKLIFLVQDNHYYCLSRDNSLPSGLKEKKSIGVGIKRVQPYNLYQRYVDVLDTIADNRKSRYVVFYKESTRKVPKASYNYDKFKKMANKCNVFGQYSSDQIIIEGEASDCSSFLLKIRKYNIEFTYADVPFVGDFSDFLNIWV